MAQLTADNVFGGLVSYELMSDSDREWLGRAAGWLSAIAIAWAIVAFLVFAGGYAVQEANPYIKQYIVASGGIIGVISGIATALLGSSSKTPARSSDDDQGSATAIAFNIGLAVAGPIFAAILIVTLSIALDKVLFGDSLIHVLQGNRPTQQADTLSRQAGSLSLQGSLTLQDPSFSRQGNTLSLQGNTLSVQGGTLSLQGTLPAMQGASISPARPAPSKLSMIVWFVIGFVTLGVVAAIASRCVNINRFSLHALYRNRLIRAYLGASRQERHPDRFTGFNVWDNVRMHELWPPGISPRQLFHVINIALNVVSTKRLAWQERKAEPFTVSPKHCGGAYLGFRPSKLYGDGPDKYKTSSQDADENKAQKNGDEWSGDHRFGIALGTAMAISGAAVSSNMGYHSSPSLGLLMTLFNVRLGWWLGNPGPAGETHNAYQREGPRSAARPLFEEAFGQTTDQRAYVYLSDGGHFENLGLYEMVRRRCRFIIAIDAGCDPGFAFEDLGNAARKIYIDLGIRIRFEGLEKLRNRPAKDDPPPETIPYHAIGVIDYESADGSKSHCENGYVLYIKPAYHGTEGAAVRSYAKANKTFPHETTTDQWFTESQFESYRALGMDIVNDILGYEVLLKAEDVSRGVSKLTLHDVLKALPAAP